VLYHVENCVNLCHFGKDFLLVLGLILRVRESMATLHGIAHVGGLLPNSEYSFYGLEFRCSSLVFKLCATMHVQ
jgi:hypothetical protein